MKTKLIISAQCALMLCLIACNSTQEPNNPSEGSTNKNEAFDKNGAISKGIFSVADGKQVKFSRGNLQYQPSTGIWRFAENQYDFVGKDNESDLSTYTGWIDLYAWGTGETPTKHGHNEDFLVFTDWGVNKISNGGNKSNLWRTLNADEWKYLFNGRENANSKYAFAIIKDVYTKHKGLLFLPDDWSMPEGLSFYKGEENTYTLEEWTQLQNAGAVFLPEAGSFWNSYNEGGGYYWSSTPTFEERWSTLTAGYLSFGVGYGLKFYENDPDFSRANHKSVRLVTQ